MANSKMLDPSVARLFCSVRHLPSEFEERRIAGIPVAELVDAPLREWHINFGHPTEAIVHFVKRLAIKSPDKVPSGYMRSLCTVLVASVEACAGLRFVPKSGAANNLPTAMSDDDKEWGPIPGWVPLDVDIGRNTWTPPCHTPDQGPEKRGCNPLCAALCVRFAVLMHAAEMAEEEGEWAILNNVYAHIDSHMPVLCAITNTLEKGGCGQANLHHLLEQSEPSLAWAYTAENVPDLTSLMSLAITYNHTEASNKRVAQMKLPHLNAFNIDVILKLVNDLYKRVPHRCNNREYSKLAEKSCKTDGRMREFTSKIVIASLLGVYEKAHQKLPIDMRIMLYHLFYLPVPQTELLDMLNESNKITLLYVGKEHFREMSERLPGFLEAIGNVYDWNMYDLYTTRACDAIRRQVVINLGDTTTPPRNLNDILFRCDTRIHHLHEEYRTSQLESTANNDIRIITKCCEEMNLTRYNRANREVTAGQEYLLPNPHPELGEAEATLMRELVETFPAEKWIPMDWLVYFDGVDTSHVVAMKRAVFSKIPELMRTLDKLPERTYAVFYNFFRLCREHSEHREFIGDAHMYLCHARALYNTHGIREGDEIPPVAGTIQVCPNCGDTKHPSFFERKFRNKGTAKGSGVMVMTGDGITVCARDSKPGDWRDIHRQIHGNDQTLQIAFTDQKVIHQTDETKSRKDAKHIAKQHLLRKCGDTPTQTVDGLRKVTYFRGHVYVGCFNCIKLIQLDDPETRYVGAKILCQDCTTIAYTVEEPEHKCEACGKSIRNRSDCKFIYAYDDKAPVEERQLRDIMLCPAHGEIRWIKHAHTIMSFSYILTGINERWSSRMLTDGTFMPIAR
jgi:hypothetical protein